MSRRLQVWAVSGLPEIEAGDDLAALLCTHSTDLADGDVLVVTSKVVSKAEGRVVTVDRGTAVARETVRVVARRGATVIARTRHGLTLAAAGVDASNTAVGTVVLLPLDPDASARHLREALAKRCGVNVAVVVSDTAGRAWREGQTDLAVGCAGLLPSLDLRGAVDRYGNVLTVTTPAVADELAAAADLVLGKLDHAPVAVLRGLADLTLPTGQHGPGAIALVRDAGSDMFGLGAREAVAAAVSRDDPQALEAFGAADPDPSLLEQLIATATAGSGVRLQSRPLDHGGVEVSGEASGEPTAQTAVALERLHALVVAHGWRAHDPDRNYAPRRIVVRSEGTGP
ncbi:MAG: coenzyme F420-0:L-glutamate ligase [Actinomycetota bacterium]|nr:coenzyme F420-0:L-glutamate ligase [Actinomycetota bacterium]